MAAKTLFLFFQCIFHVIISIDEYTQHADIGCNYVNLGGVAMPTDYCMRMKQENVTFEGYIAFQCNDTLNGVNLNFFASSDCNVDSVIYSEDFTSSLLGFDCNKTYDSVSCPQVSLLAYNGDICSGDDYVDYRLVVDGCLAVDYNESIYSKISCTTDSAIISWYHSPNNNYNIDNCNDTHLINKTVLREGELEGIEAGCIDVDGCYEDGEFIPRTDIGCNYINAGDGIPLPTDHCMQINMEAHMFYTKFMCNDAWNGIELQIHLKPDCSDKPFMTQDYTNDLLEFECNAEYQYKVCNEVSLNAWPTDTCEGDKYSIIRFITNACVPVFNNGSFNTFAELTCTQDTLTYSEYNIPLDDYGNCRDKYLFNQTNITDGGLDGEFAKCIDIEGCGDYAHDVVDVGCNYINFDGFGIPTDICMKSKTDEASHSWKIYCNASYDGIFYGEWDFDKDCHGTPREIKPFTPYFPFVCSEDYKDIECDTVTLTGYLGKKCSGSQYYQLSFITDVCLYNDVDDYTQVNCNGYDGSLSIYETTDGVCNDDTLVNTKALDTFEIMDTVFGCVDIEHCDHSMSTIATTTSQPIPIPVITGITHMDSTATSLMHVEEKQKGKSAHESNKGFLSTIPMVAVVSAGGSCILLIGVFLLIKYIKQKREIKNMDVTKTGQLVRNPYGEIE